MVVFLVIQYAELNSYILVPGGLNGEGGGALWLYYQAIETHTTIPS